MSTPPSSGHSSPVKGPKPFDRGSLTGDGRDGYPSRRAFDYQMAEYLANLNERKREKALMSQQMYDLILKVLVDPRNTSIETAQFRFWAKKMFRMVNIRGTWLVTHENHPVAVKEQIYDILVHAHGICSHGGRDKTSAQVRVWYSWIPKELIARFVKACPLCTARRTSNKSYFAEMSSDGFYPLPKDNVFSSPTATRHGFYTGGYVPTNPSFALQHALVTGHADEQMQAQQEQLDALQAMPAPVASTSFNYPQQPAVQPDVEVTPCDPVISYPSQPTFSFDAPADDHPAMSFEMAPATFFGGEPLYQDAYPSSNAVPSPAYAVPVPAASPTHTATSHLLKRRKKDGSGGRKAKLSVRAPSYHEVSYGGANGVPSTAVPTFNFAGLESVPMERGFNSAPPHILNFDDMAAASLGLSPFPHFDYAGLGLTDGEGSVSPLSSAGGLPATPMDHLAFDFGPGVDYAYGSPAVVTGDAASDLAASLGLPPPGATPKSMANDPSLEQLNWSLIASGGFVPNSLGLVPIPGDA